MTAPLFHPIGYATPDGLMTAYLTIVPPDNGMLIQFFYHPYTGKFLNMRIQAPDNVKFVTPEMLKKEKL